MIKDRLIAIYKQYIRVIKSRSSLQTLPPQRTTTTTNPNFIINNNNFSYNKNDNLLRLLLLDINQTIILYRVWRYYALLARNNQRNNHH